MDCSWCGGSRYAYRNIMGVDNTLVQKDNHRVIDELRTMGDAARTTSIYALQCYSETRAAYINTSMGSGKWAIEASPSKSFT